MHLEQREDRLKNRVPPPTPGPSSFVHFRTMVAPRDGYQWHAIAQQREAGRRDPELALGLRKGDTQGEEC